MPIQTRLFDSTTCAPGHDTAQACALPQSYPLVHDAEGGIVYIEPWLDADTLQTWFALLRGALPWQAVERPMYERIVAVPRLVCSTSVAAIAHPSKEGSALGAALHALYANVRMVASQVQQRQVPFTHMGFNYYRHGQDSVALHGDKLHQLQAPWPIAVFSLGAARTMLIKPAHAAARHSSQRITLAAGSLLLMSHASQRTHLHGIPKTARTVDPRISCALRVRPSTH